MLRMGNKIDNIKKFLEKTFENADEKDDLGSIAADSNIFSSNL